MGHTPKGHEEAQCSHNEAVESAPSRPKSGPEITREGNNPGVSMVIQGGVGLPVFIRGYHQHQGKEHLDFLISLFRCGIGQKGRQVRLRIYQ
jgi:hypothetical protein